MEPTHVVWVPFEEAVAQVMQGLITESVSVAGILKLAVSRIASDSLSLPPVLALSPRQPS
jgi:hypothetical protein